jgi:hypothetical protein
LLRLVSMLPVVTVNIPLIGSNSSAVASSPFSP